MPCLSNQPWLISSAKRTGLAEQCESSVCGAMSARLTMVPSSAMKAMDEQIAATPGYQLAEHWQGLRVRIETLRGDKSPRSRAAALTMHGEQIEQVTRDSSTSLQPARALPLLLRADSQAPGSDTGRQAAAAALARAALTRG